MPDAAFFRPELFDFMCPLKRHKTTDWFARNKQRYRQAVRDPGAGVHRQLRAAPAQTRPAFRRPARVRLGAACIWLISKADALELLR